MGTAICYRLLLRRLQQLGQTSRWHVHIALLPQAISVEHRLPPLHVHRSTRRNRQADVSPLQYPSRSIRVSIPESSFKLVHIAASPQFFLAIQRIGSILHPPPLINFTALFLSEEQHSR